MNRYSESIWVAAVVLGFFAVSVSGADLYSSGSKTWNTTSNNWGTAFGGPYNTAVWNNGTPDSAFLEGESGAGGTITLAESINLVNLTFSDNTANNGPQPNERSFVVQGHTLNFSPGGEIRAHLTADARGGSSVTISSAITGGPAAYVGDNNHHLYFTPTSGTVALATCYVPYENGVWDKAQLHLGGTTAGNTVGEITYLNGQRWGTVYKEGSGTWTVGNVLNGGLFIQEGDLIATGEIDMRYGGLRVNGGVLHYNNEGVMKNGTFQLNNGALDNSSGAPITTSKYNPAQTWGGNWTFIGSNGSDSDLYLGTGAATLTGDRTVTIQNATATLTVGGAVGDGAGVYGLTKAGAGTLRLTGNNTYEGNTTVNEGALSITQLYLADGAMVDIAMGATLNLDFSGTDTILVLKTNGVSTAPGTWGRIGSGADHETALITGDGLIGHTGGLAPAGTWYWDGGMVDIPTDGDGASAGGNGTWSTSIANWDHGLTSHKAWSNTSNDKAIFRAAAGTVDLQSDITLGEILIDGVDNYAIGTAPETQVLNFGGAASIVVDKVTATINAGITGNPEVHHYGGFRENLILDPDAVSMQLGTITVGEDTSSNPRLYLRGTTTGNSATSIQKAWTYSFVHKEDSGTWTVGDIDIGEINLSSGKLVINGTSVTPWSSFKFAGGTLAGTGVINDAITVPAAGTIAPGDPTGTLTVTNNDCTINGALAITVDGSQVSTLTVDGLLDISSATLEIVPTGAAGGTVVIANYNSLAGTFAAVNAPDSGWVVDYTANGGTAMSLRPPSYGAVLTVR